MNADKRIPPARLIALAHHRWNIPVLAELHRLAGAKYVTLANTLGVSRGPLTASLNDLIDQGLVRRNPGHGHPMRPEYLLTPAGRTIGAHCHSLAETLDRRDESDLAYRKWTLPLVVAIGEQICRFNELRTALGEHATPRAITLGLKAMQSTGWVERSVVDTYPPAAGYHLAPKGREIFGLIAELC